MLMKKSSAAILDSAKQQVLLFTPEQTKVFTDLLQIVQGPFACLQACTLFGICPIKDTILDLRRFRLFVNSFHFDGGGSEWVSVVPRSVFCVT